MAGFCKERELKKAAEGDLKTLTDFDKRGLIIGAMRLLLNMWSALKSFKKILDMQASLDKDKEFTVEDIKFPDKEKIPPSI